MNTKVVIFGLSTEGYELARKIAVNGGDVQIIDESTPSAITIKSDIAKTYPNVQAIKDDEPLLPMTPINLAVSKAQILFFAPRIRKTGQDIKTELNSKFKEAVTNIKKGCSVVYCLGTGFGGNAENISLLEHVTGFKPGKTVSYFYYPLTRQDDKTIIGTDNGKTHERLSSLLSLKKNTDFVSISTAEHLHAINILKRFSDITCILEVCKFTKDNELKAELNSNEINRIYLDDMIDNLFDLRSLGSSFEGASSLTYMINGSLKGVDGYMKKLIDEIRLVLKRNELKASRTKILLLWSLDTYEMKGEKYEKLAELETKLKDYIGDVESIQKSLDIFSNDKTVIIVACSQMDYDYISTDKKNNEYIIIKANPLCEVFPQK
jgi:hypothetical protein|tara:strand:+ start:66 stop:1199 length:1134 start_codon:yes stop_codon:yes gene_type:complete